MTRLPAKVLIVDRLADQYLITVKVCEKHRCRFDKLNFGEKKPHLGSYRRTIYFVDVPQPDLDSSSRLGSDGLLPFDRQETACSDRRQSCRSPWHVSVHA